MRLIIALALFLAGCGSSGNTANVGDLLASGAFDEPALELIAFGSCVGQAEPQPIWDAVVGLEPDLFLFLGDNILADTEDMSVMRAKYVQQSEQPGIRKLFATTPVMATWDDHDYGRNDAGAEYPAREGAKREFLRFFAIPESADVWAREGVYSSRTFGPPGRRVQVIMLDTRYFRGPLQRWPDGGRQTLGPYRPSDDTTATMLGGEQWRWLEARLGEPADVRIIATSIQAVAGEHGFESWTNLPHERRRLFDLIERTRAGGVVLVSGDRHLAEISALPADDPEGVGYPLHDVTASSLNQPSRAQESEPNRYRAVEGNYKEENFGTIQIDWGRSDPGLLLQIRNINGDVVLQTAVALSELEVGRAP